jgi:hypothetical protein
MAAGDRWAVIIFGSDANTQARLTTSHRQPATEF